jgi:serine/threonine protein phosphatase 1
MVGIVHADCPVTSWKDFVTCLADPAFPPQRREHLTSLAIWSRARIQALDPSGVGDIHAIVVGHTPLERYSVLGNVHFIDTGAVFDDGHFTLLHLADLTPLHPPAREPQGSQAG